MTTREQAMRAAAQILVDTWEYCRGLTPEQQAAEAYVPGGAPVEELAERIRADRERAAGQAAA
jgi:hypothetical protein